MTTPTKERTTFTLLLISGLQSSGLKTRTTEGLSHKTNKLCNLTFEGLQRFLSCQTRNRNIFMRPLDTLMSILVVLLQVTSPYDSFRTLLKIHRFEINVISKMFNKVSEFRLKSYAMKSTFYEEILKVFNVCS